MYVYDNYFTLTIDTIHFRKCTVSMLLPLMVLTLRGRSFYSAIKFVSMVIDHTLSACIASISTFKVYIAISLARHTVWPSETIDQFLLSVSWWSLAIIVISIYSVVNTNIKMQFLLSVSWWSLAIIVISSVVNTNIKRCTSNFDFAK